MFGKPQWFKQVSGGLGLVPVAWQGWLYVLVWSTAAMLPAAALIASSKRLEAAIWTAASLALLVRDTRQILHEKRREELFVIDEDTDVTKITTSNFDLELRR